MEEDSTAFMYFTISFGDLNVVMNEAFMAVSSLVKV